MNDYKKNIYKYKLSENSKENKFTKLSENSDWKSYALFKWYYINIIKSIIKSSVAIA